MKNSSEKKELLENVLILCIGMPGAKIISRYDCGKRHLLARIKALTFSTKDFDLDQMSSLEICCTCVEGSINVKRYKNLLRGDIKSPDESAEHGKRNDIILRSN